MEAGLVISIIIATALGVAISSYIGFEFRKAINIFLYIYFPATIVIFILDLIQDMLGNHKFGMSLFLVVWTLVSFIVIVYKGKSSQI